MERIRGAALAKKHGLKKTAELISTGKCYMNIFRMAIKECGSVDRVIEIIVGTKDAELVVEFVEHVKELKRKQLDALIAVMTKNGNAYLVYELIRCKQKFLQRQRDALISVVLKEKDMHEVVDAAYDIAYFVRDLTHKQVNMLISVIVKAKDPVNAWYFGTDIEGLTRVQLDALVSVVVESGHAGCAKNFVQHSGSKLNKKQIARLQALYHAR